jgi:hypothetical protein
MFEKKLSRKEIKTSPSQSVGICYLFQRENARGENRSFAIVTDETPLVSINEKIYRLIQLHRHKESVVEGVEEYECSSCWLV